MHTKCEEQEIAQDIYNDNCQSYTLDDLGQKTRNRVIRKMHGVRNAEKYLYSEKGEVVGKYSFGY